MKTYILIFLSSYFSLLSSQNLSKDQIKQLDKLIDSKTEAIAPGLAVGVVKNGKIIYKRFSGYANLEHSVKIDENTRFNLASNAKQFTAILALKLVQEGRLNLNDDIRTYLPKLFKNNKSKITIEHLISHRSGIRDYVELADLMGKTWWRQVSLDNDDVISYIENQEDLNFTPGSEYLYSNTNYIILVKIIEAIEAKKFWQVADAFFKEKKMNDTSFRFSYYRVLPNLSRAYNYWNRWIEYVILTNVYGDGALYSTLNDQLQWEKLIQNSTNKLILESQKHLPEKENLNYGYGVEIKENRGLKSVYHTGATLSYGAHFYRYPTLQLSLVVLTNNGQIWSTGTADECLDIIFGKIENESFPTSPFKTLKRPKNSDIIGIYQFNTESTIMEIVEKDNELYRIIMGRDPVKLIHVEGNLFKYQSNNDLQIEFLNNENGNIFKLYHPEIITREATMKEMLKLDAKYLKSLTGSFYNKELDLTIELRHENGKKFQAKKTNRTYKATLMLNDQIQFSSYSIIMNRDQNYKIIGFKLNSSRIKNVNFVKKD